MNAILPLFLIFALPTTASDFAGDPTRARKIEQMFSEYQHQFSDTPMISVEELISIQGHSKVLVVDVRTPRERNVSMIPQAISQDDFEKNAAPKKGSKVVVYCTIGHRSGLYAEKLRKNGLDAYNLKGGILSWADAGQLLVDKKGPTKRVHVYGEKWNLLPPDYEAVW